MTEIMPSLQNLINLSYDPRRNGRGIFYTDLPPCGAAVLLTLFAVCKRILSTRLSPKNTKQRAYPLLYCYL